MKLTKPFYGVQDGDIYPKWYQPGEECPPELLKAAKAADAVEAEKPTRKARADGNTND